MTIKKKTPFAKPLLATKPLVSGSIKVVAKAERGAGAYEWQMSTDGGATWAQLPSTVQATTTVHGLPPATTVSFRVRVLMRKGAGDWLDPISALVT